jgi:DNA-directed RNA polymerase subunit M/transcription elongation factor TFIIS
MWKSLSEETPTMPPTFIVECPQCSGLLLAAADQKTRTCPYCGARVDLHRARRLAKAENAFDASEILRKIKADRQVNARKTQPK